MNRHEKLRHAVNDALAGDWDKSHRIVQEFSDPISCWIHAVLHKIEGDQWNSHYWYRQCEAEYEDFADPTEELQHIQQELDKH